MARWQHPGATAAIITGAQVAATVATDGGSPFVEEAAAVVERALAATGNETIEVSSREVAEKAADEFVGEGATGMKQNCGNRAGRTVGKQSTDGIRNFRDDGDHFNFVNKATGGSLHVKLPGGQ